MRIAILGSRGIPCTYGGFERFAEELSTRLVLKGYEVLVYCCKPYSNIDNRNYKGVKRVILPTIRNKFLEKPVYAFISILHVLFQKVDIVLMLGVSVSLFCFIPRLLGIKVLINIDGLEWKRKKWNRLVRYYLKMSERVSGFVANKVITDSIYIKDYFIRKYKREALYIPYGSNIIQTSSTNILNRYSLKPNEYFLYVGRFEIENNPLEVREAFDELSDISKKLVMVGDAPFANKYIKKVKETKNSRIVFTGNIFGDEYLDLLNNAFCYIQGSEVGGTHPALLEAMGAGRCIIANDIPEHREVLRDACLYYNGKEDLKKKLELVIKNEILVKEKGDKAKKIAEDEYSWEDICKKYERVFLNFIEKNDE